MSKNKIAKISNIAPDLVVIACCLLSLGLSVIESRVNSDAHHWGLMYANATQLNQGLIPYKEIFIQYGFITTWIQGISLNFLGDTVVAVGVITGVFYAINIYLSYCLWQKILNRWLSALSALLMFLVHGYIIYPWSNYISYTFLLLSLLFLVNSQEKKGYYLLSGVCFALNVLARQTALVPTLVPIELYFIWSYIASEKKIRQKIALNVAIFHLGIATIFGAFYLYLLKVDAGKDWYLQSITLADVYKAKFGGGFGILKKFIKRLIWPATRDPRLILYSLMFFNAVILWFGLIIQVFRAKVTENIEIKKALFLFSSVALFGYLQSIHIYETFRLQSASSLAIGLIIFSLDKISIRFPKWHKLGVGIPLVFLIVVLSKTLIFQGRSSTYYPWDKNRLLKGQLHEPANIPMLKGKLYRSQINDYYENLKETLEKYRDQLDYLVNHSNNSYVLFLSDQFQIVQKSPFYDREMSSLIFPDEEKLISQLFAQEKAILVTTNSPENPIPPNYCPILELDSRVMTTLFIRDPLYIAVPKKLVKDCKNIT